MTAVDVLLFAFRGVTCLLCLSSEPFLESLLVGCVVHKERWLLCGNLHQGLPVLMAVLELNDPQVMVLASFYCFRRDLSFIFSLKNTLI